MAVAICKSRTARGKDGRREGWERRGGEEGRRMVGEVRKGGGWERRGGRMVEERRMEGEVRRMEGCSMEHTHTPIL